MKLMVEAPRKLRPLHEQEIEGDYYETSVLDPDHRLAMIK
jgi:hypothetical protein